MMGESQRERERGRVADISWKGNWRVVWSRDWQDWVVNTVLWLVPSLENTELWLVPLVPSPGTQWVCIGPAAEERRDWDELSVSSSTASVLTCSLGQTRLEHLSEHLLLEILSFIFISTHCSSQHIQWTGQDRQWDHCAVCTDSKV